MALAVSGWKRPSTLRRVFGVKGRRHWLSRPPDPTLSSLRSLLRAPWSALIVNNISKRAEVQLLAGPPLPQCLPAHSRLPSAALLTQAPVLASDSPPWATLLPVASCDAYST